MDNNAVVTIEELDGHGTPWRILTSHMVGGNVDRSLTAIRAGYDMDRTRIKVDGRTVQSPASDSRTQPTASTRRPINRR